LEARDWIIAIYDQHGIAFRRRASVSKARQRAFAVPPFPQTAIFWLRFFLSAWAGCIPHSLGGLHHLPGCPGLTEAAINAGSFVVIDCTRGQWKAGISGLSRIEGPAGFSITTGPTSGYAPAGGLVSSACFGRAGNGTAAAAHAFLGVHERISSDRMGHTAFSHGPPQTWHLPGILPQPLHFYRIPPCLKAALRQTFHRVFILPEKRQDELAAAPVAVTDQHVDRFLINAICNERFLIGRSQKGDRLLGSHLPTHAAV